ncbi:pyridoxal phosphate-dependent aminotransferase [Desulfovibrio sp. OttesenSCG-928-A18]|nr:pyridoxal phosphate-dependent aminotransferase [Desulfovibrio sp. OttesenSCG-928-A18]
MKLADRVSQLKPSATLAVSTRAQELKAQGKHILSLSVGEPDFPTPVFIREAAKKALDDGFTRYTPVPGLPEAREAAAAYFNRYYGVNATIDNIILGNGGKHCLYALCQCMLNPGDHVLIPAPYWVSYPPMVELAGAKPVIIATAPEKSFKITPAELEKSLTPKTRLLLLNSPSNPTGACYTGEELDAIAQWAVDKGVIVISDEIYDRLVYGGLPSLSLCSWWERYPENFVIVNGLAKTFSMTGWRVGYTLAQPELIKAMTRLQGQSTSNICSIAQKAAVAALSSDLKEVETMCKAFERRRDLAMSIVSTWPDVVCPKPNGAFYIFPDVHRHYRERFPDSTCLCTFLLSEAGVALVPGAAFGDDRCIRISYAVSDEVLEEALQKVAKVLFA